MKGRKRVLPFGILQRYRRPRADAERSCATSRGMIMLASRLMTSMRLERRRRA